MTLPYYEDPNYWSGELNRRDGHAVSAYRDYEINALKAACLVHVLNELPARIPRTVLDAGCAYGYLVRWLRRMGVEARGVDVSGYATDRAPESVKPYTTRATLMNLPFPAKSFGLVVTTGVLEHFDTKLELPYVMMELARVAYTGFMAITLRDDPGAAEDRHHPALWSAEEWQEMMPPSFIARSDSSEFWIAAHETLP